MPVPVGASTMRRLPLQSPSAFDTDSAISACCGRGVRPSVINEPPERNDRTTSPMLKKPDGTAEPGMGTSGTASSRLTGSRCVRTKAAQGWPARWSIHRCRQRARSPRFSSSSRASMIRWAIRESFRASCEERASMPNHAAS